MRWTTVRAARQASQHQRPQLLTLVPQEKLPEFRANLFKQRTELTPQEWQEAREMLISSYKHINAHNIDAVILGICNEAEQLPLAKNYVAYLRAQGIEPNAATLGRLLRVYNAAYHARGGTDQALTPEEQADILQIHVYLRQKYGVLDASSCEHLIQGLVATTQWRDAKELLEMMKLSATPTVQAYTELTQKAFVMADFALGWQLMEEMVSNRKQPKCEVFIAYLKAIAKKPESCQQELEKMLRFLEQHELVITEKVVCCLETLAQQLPAVYSVAKTQLNRAGKCDQCGNHLQNVCVSDAEFEALSNAFLHKVLIRQDVFQKSTPEEVERFKRFVEQTAPYDCVIDGLNVAYSAGAKKPPQMLAKLLSAVVQHFKQRNKHVLVLGRKHMNSWPKDTMQFVRKNAAMFLTNNLTHDDPFLLYATIKSGQSTDFFSRDLMRTHAYLLGPELKSIFRRWQQEHQYALVTQTDSGRIIVKEPIRHLIYAHKVANHWHLPYKGAYSANPADTFELPESWLCLKIQ